MRSATTKRSVGGLVAFVVGLGASMVLVVGALVVGGGKPAGFVTAVPSGGSAVASAGSGSAQPAPAPDNQLNVIEREFAIATDKTTLKAGTITFNITNNGTTPHNIEVVELKKATDNIDPGKSATLSVDLKPGTYTVICNIPGHDQLGMKITLTVQ
ncbi:MAG: cupredoxin domain-containing protein [Thermomicrobiales bacterium]